MHGRVLIVAHFHAEGRLRDDTLNLLARAVDCFDTVLLVSTGIDEAAAKARLPPNVRLLVRPNIGYDFFSYRAGLLEVKDLPGLMEVVLMNDSIYIDDPHLFTSRCLAPLPLTTDYAALTQNFEVVPHGQSFFLIFRRSALRRQIFWQWWEEQQPLSDKDEIVLKQEIGLSHYLNFRNFSFSSIFQPNRFCHFALSGISVFPARVPEREMEILMLMNPTHHFWPELLKQFGFIKLEVLRDNPFKYDLAGELALLTDRRRVLDLFRS